MTLNDEESYKQALLHNDKEFMGRMVKINEVLSKEAY